MRSRTQVVSIVSRLILVTSCFATRAAFVRGDDLPKDEAGVRYYVWKNEESPGVFSASGWMPDGQGFSQSTAEKETPHSEPHCLRMYCQLTQKPWVGVYFLLEGEWEPQAKLNLFEKLGAKQDDRVKCRFWARSPDGVYVQFKVGGVTKGMIKDSLVFPVSTEWLKLTPEWKMHEIDLTGKDLQSIVGAFTWVIDRQHNKSADVTFDLDDIYFVVVKDAAGKR
jgi:hypothetical protein